MNFAEKAKFQVLASNHPFSWESCIANPKYIPPQQCVRGDWFKTMEYNILHTGGFLRLSTDRGRVYWCAQNEQVVSSIVNIILRSKI